MEVNNINNDLVSQFLARQDMPKPANNPLLNTPAKEDAFVKENSQPIEAAAVKSDDTFEKSADKAAETPAPAEEIKEETKEQAPAPAEEIKEELPAQEVKDIEKTEEVKEEVAPAEEIKEDAEIGANVTKKVTVIDKIKNFFKNLFIKLKHKKAPVETCSGGGTN